MSLSAGEMSSDSTSAAPAMVLVPTRLTVSSVVRSDRERKRRSSKHDDFNDDFDDFAPASALTASNDV
jgi:hypothetical protein